MCTKTSVALLFVAGALPGVAFQSDKADRLSSVKGIVTNAVTGERLRKAYVRLGWNPNYAAVTSDQGRFSIEKIEPGAYSLEAERPGFLRSVVQLNLAAGQSLSDLAIALMPQASIAGRVVDDDGDIWNHATVYLFRSVRKQGRRQLENAGQNSVDDRGEFRIADLPPGKYYVVAEPESGWQNRFGSARSDGFLLQPTWYPGSIAEEAAAPVTLTAGQEFAGLEIRLRRGAVRNIRGHLSGFSQIPKLPGQSPFGKPMLWVSRPTSWAEGLNYTGSMQSGDAFEVTAVPPGVYQLKVTEGFPQQIVLGRATVQVDDRDVTDVVISLQAPRSIKGKITIEGDKAVDVSKLYILLDSGQNQTPQEDGSFVFEQLGVGPHRIDVNGKRDDDVYLKTVRFGDTESQNGTFALAGGAEGNLELVVSTHGARVTGTVQKNNGAAAKRTVAAVLIPDTSDPEKREFLKQQAMLDQNGSFTIHAIPPGSYLLYAAEDVP